MSDLKSLREYVLPSIPGRIKSGAGCPILSVGYSSWENIARLIDNRKDTSTDLRIIFII
jgi:hypothetical protein